MNPVGPASPSYTKQVHSPFAPGTPARDGVATRRDDWFEDLNSALDRSDARLVRESSTRGDRPAASHLPGPTRLSSTVREIMKSESVASCDSPRRSIGREVLMSRSASPSSSSHDILPVPSDGADSADMDAESRSLSLGFAFDSPCASPRVPNLGAPPLAHSPPQAWRNPIESMRSGFSDITLDPPGNIGASVIHPFEIAPLTTQRIQLGGAAFACTERVVRGGKYDPQAPDSLARHAIAEIETALREHAGLFGAERLQALIVDAVVAHADHSLIRSALTFCMLAAFEPMKDAQVQLVVNRSNANGLVIIRGEHDSQSVFIDPMDGLALASSVPTLHAGLIEASRDPHANLGAHRVVANKGMGTSWPPLDLCAAIERRDALEQHEPRSTTPNDGVASPGAASFVAPSYVARSFVAPLFSTPPSSPTPSNPASSNPASPSRAPASPDHHRDDDYAHAKIGETQRFALAHRFGVEPETIDHYADRLNLQRRMTWTPDDLQAVCTRTFEHGHALEFENTVQIVPATVLTRLHVARMAIDKTRRLLLRGPGDQYHALRENGGTEFHSRMLIAEQRVRKAHARASLQGANTAMVEALCAVRFGGGNSFQYAALTFELLSRDASLRPYAIDLVRMTLPNHGPGAPTLSRSAVVIRDAAGHPEYDVIVDPAAALPVPCTTRQADARWRAIAERAPDGGPSTPGVTLVWSKPKDYVEASNRDRLKRAEREFRREHPNDDFRLRHDDPDPRDHKTIVDEGLRSGRIQDLPFFGNPLAIYQVGEGFDVSARENFAFEYSGI